MNYSQDEPLFDQTERLPQPNSDHPLYDQTRVASSPPVPPIPPAPTSGSGANAPRSGTVYGRNTGSQPRSDAQPGADLSDTGQQRAVGRGGRQARQQDPSNPYLPEPATPAEPEAPAAPVAESPAYTAYPAEGHRPQSMAIPQNVPTPAQPELPEPEQARRHAHPDAPQAPAYQPAMNQTATHQPVPHQPAGEPGGTYEPRQEKPAKAKPGMPSTILGIGTGQLVGVVALVVALLVLGIPAAVSAWRASLKLPSPDQTAIVSGVLLLGGLAALVGGLIPTILRRTSDINESIGTRLLSPPMLVLGIGVLLLLFAAIAVV